MYDLVLLLASAAPSAPAPLPKPPPPPPAACEGDEEEEDAGEEEGEFLPPAWMLGNFYPEWLAYRMWKHHQWESDSCYAAADVHLDRREAWQALGWEHAAQASRFNALYRAHCWSSARTPLSVRAFRKALNELRYAVGDYNFYRGVVAPPLPHEGKPHK